jgi:hypothetical protein
MGYQFGIRYIDMVVYHIDMVILDIDMGYGLMIWEMTVSIRSSPISIWDILSLWPCPVEAAQDVVGHSPPVAVEHPHGRGLHSFRFQLNSSSSVHRVTQHNPKCILKLLKLSSNVNRCKPLPHGVHGGAPRDAESPTDRHPSHVRAVPLAVHWLAAVAQGLTLVHFSAQP